MRTLSALALLLFATVAALAQDSGTRLALVRGEADNPFDAKGVIGDIRGCDYVYTYPDAAAPNSATLYRLDTDAAREVKAAGGGAIAFDNADFFPDGDGLYVRTRSKGNESLWWVNGLVAAAVKSANDQQLSADTLTIAAAVNPHVLARGKDGMAIWRLEKGMAQLAMRKDAAFADQYEITLFPGAQDLLLGLYDNTVVAPKVTLHQVAKGELAAIKDPLGEPARATEYTSRVAGKTQYLSAINGRERQVFIAAGGKLQPLLLPTGKPVMTDLRFTQVFDDTLLLDLRDGETNALWVVRGDSIETVKTIEGGILKSPAFTTLPMRGRALINAYDKDLNIAQLWLFDGKAAVPLAGADGKQVSGKQPFMAWHDGKFLLRVKNAQSSEDEYFSGLQAKVTGPLLSDSGTTTTGMNLVLGRGRSLLYAIDMAGKTWRLLRPAP